MAAFDRYQQDLLTHALGYAARGWHVFPLRPGTKKPATPNHPAHLCDQTDPKCCDGHTGWEQRATTNPDRIERAWTKRPYGIGIATGPSGLLVVDLDIPKTPGHLTGAERLNRLLEESDCVLPPTFVVVTPSGGRHLYFTAPPGSGLGNTASRLGPYIDTRANGGYVVAPPTQLNQHERYQLVAACEEIPQLPDWIASTLAAATQPPTTRPTRRSRPVVGSEPVERYVDAALKNEAKRIRTAPEGTRNNTLFTAAIALGQLVGAELVGLDAVHGLLLGAADSHLAAGAYTTTQAHKTIASGLHRGQNQPRQLPPTLTEVDR